MTRRTRHLIVVAALLVLCALPAGVRAECEPEPVTPDTPTGIKGCVIYGEGTASMWGGPGVARNDCVWPWTACTPIAIQSLDTGLTIIVTPRMFCDCYTGTAQERIVDLDPAAVAALGLDPARGLFPVRVTPLGPAMLPNTAMMQATGDETVSIESRAAHRSAHPTRWAAARLWRMSP